MFLQGLEKDLAGIFSLLIIPTQKILQRYLNAKNLAGYMLARFKVAQKIIGVIL